MSYILEALKKSDQERRGGDLPSLLADRANVSTTQARPRPGLWLAGALLFVAGTTLGWLYADHPSPGPKAPGSNAVEPPSRPAMPPQGMAPQATPLQLEPKPAPLPAPSPARPKVEKPVSLPPADTSQPAPLEIPAVARNELPGQIQQALPAMTVSMHAYSQNRSSRWVSVNDKLLQEGDTLAPDLILEAITPKDMVFSYKGHRFRQGL